MRVYIHDLDVASLITVVYLSSFANIVIYSAIIDIRLVIEQPCLFDKFLTTFKSLYQKHTLSIEVVKYSIIA